MSGVERERERERESARERAQIHPLDDNRERGDSSLHDETHKDMGVNHENDCKNE